MDLLQLREGEIFKTLKALKPLDFVLVGGYAANAYALPRFSVDCDIVVKDKKEAEGISSRLKELGYSKREKGQDLPYGGSFERYEKQLENRFKVSVDVLISGVQDRQTGAVFGADWIFENSKTRELRGKTITEKLSVKIIGLDALFAMKAVSARAADIRDVFMLAPKVENWGWVMESISRKCNLKRLAKIVDTVNSKQFRDGLQGVYGQIDDAVFRRHSEAINERLGGSV